MTDATENTQAHVAAMHPGHFVALSGGVGGAKLVLGLSKLLDPAQITIVANTGDDFEHLGLKICPDLDTVLYTLADWNNKELGWGQVGESWNFLDALKRLGGESWFNLGDRDLATHFVRTQMLNQGKSLSEVVTHLSQLLGIAEKIVPMTDDQVSTIIHCDPQGSLSFQHYFVRDRCEPTITGFEFAGMNTASPSRGFLQALDDKLTAILVCPSNPFVSVDPILKLPGIVTRLQALDVPLVVVSNIIGGEAIKGPAAKMMSELGIPRTALGVAQHYVDSYGDLFKGFVLDQRDAHLKDEIESLGLAVTVTNTLMVTVEDKINLAADVLAFTHSLGARS